MTWRRTRVYRSSIVRALLSWLLYAVRYLVFCILLPSKKLSRFVEVYTYVFIGGRSISLRSYCCCVITRLVLLYIRTAVPYGGPVQHVSCNTGRNQVAAVAAITCQYPVSHHTSNVTVRARPYLDWSLNDGGMWHVAHGGF